MSVFFSPGLFTKLGGLIALIGGLMVSSGDLTYGPAIVGIGSFIGNWASRQANVSSEQAGAGITPPSNVIPLHTPVEDVREAPESLDQTTYNK